jgi:hypothetical protein
MFYEIAVERHTCLYCKFPHIKPECLVVQAIRLKEFCGDEEEVTCRRTEGQWQKQDKKRL